MDSVKTYKSESGSATGYEVRHDTSVVRLITWTEYDTEVPYMYIEKLGTYKPLEKDKLFMLALNTFRDTPVLKEEKEVREWLKKVSDTYHKLMGMLSGGEKIDYEIDENRSVSIRPCSYGDGPVEYYLADGIESGDNIYSLAEGIVNIEQSEVIHEHEKERLYDYYKKEIAPYIFMSMEQLSEEVRDAFGFYSDWHKDVYGFRPHGLDKDMCYQRSLTERKDNINIILEWEYRSYLFDGTLKDIDRQDRSMYDDLKAGLEEHLEDDDSLEENISNGLGIFFEDLCAKYGMDDDIHWANGNSSYFETSDIREELISFVKSFIKRSGDNLRVYPADMPSEEDSDELGFYIKSDYRADVLLPVKTLYKMLEERDAKEYKAELDVMNKAFHINKEKKIAR